MEATVSELKEREKGGKNDYVLLDVREDYERAEFNVGGIHVPLGQLSMSMDKLTPYRDQEIIVYCRSGKTLGDGPGAAPAVGLQERKEPRRGHAGLSGLVPYFLTLTFCGTPWPRSRPRERVRRFRLLPYSRQTGPRGRPHRCRDRNLTLPLSKILPCAGRRPGSGHLLPDGSYRR